MDQDSFRRLLVARSEDSLTPAGTIYKSKKKAILDPSQPAFQPRKVTKKISKSEYRDRASERRSGVNEYSKVESVLEDFQRRIIGIEDPAEVEKQRKYLGGDEDHTILVKGLDFALLEQNKSRAAASNVDDDSLEAAFQERLETRSAVPRTRTREELLRELKEKRAADGTGNGHSSLMSPETDDALEKAKKVGKFKPIGALDGLMDKGAIKKPTGKAKERAEEGGRKKKRRKVVHDLTEVSAKHPSELDRSQPSMQPSPGPSTSAIQAAPLHPADICIDEQATPQTLENDGDMDIFADVGEYEGIDFEAEDDDSNHSVNPSPSVEGAVVSASSQTQGDMRAISWFTEDKETTPQPTLSAVHPPDPPAMPELPEEPDLEQPTRLAPLASSTLPSIRDFLDMDAQDGAKKKRRAKNEKKQGEKKGRVSTKIDRDYKRLNSYISKKGDHVGTS